MFRKSFAIVSLLFWTPAAVLPARCCACVLRVLVFRYCFVSVSLVFRECFVSVSRVFRECFVSVLDPPLPFCRRVVLHVFCECFASASASLMFR